MNPNEIKKDLENWIKNFDGTVVEMATLSGTFLYINQLEAEVERLTLINRRLESKNDSLEDLKTTLYSKIDELEICLDILKS